MYANSMGEIILEENAGVYIMNPNVAYITVIAHDSNEDSRFKLVTSLNKRNEEDLSEMDKTREIQVIKNLVASSSSSLTGSDSDDDE